MGCFQQYMRDCSWNSFFLNSDGRMVIEEIINLEDSLYIVKFYNYYLSEKYFMEYK